jgi:hypothetical protein
MMKLVLVLCAAAPLVAAAVPTLAAVNAPTVDDKLQAACYPDVNRLCKDAMPDEDKVEVCMKQHKAEVGAKCKAAYKESGRHDD